MKGEVIYLCAYDIAYEANIAEIEKRMLGTAERLRLGRLKDAPRSFPVYRPLTIQIEDMQMEGPEGPVTLSTFVKLFSVGVISVKVRIPVSCQRITDLVAFRDLRFKDDTTLDQRIREIVARLFEEYQAAPGHARRRFGATRGLHHLLPQPAVGGRGRCGRGRCGCPFPRAHGQVALPPRARGGRPAGRRDRPGLPQRPGNPGDDEVQVFLLSTRSGGAWNGIRRSWWTRRKAARTRSTSWRWPTSNWRS